MKTIQPKHSPGPWHYHSDTGSIRDEAGEPIALVVYRKGWQKSVALMLAAPDLLAELEGIILVCERRDDPNAITLDKIESLARSVVAKVKGGVA